MKALFANIFTTLHKDLYWKALGRLFSGWQYRQVGPAQKHFIHQLKRQFDIDATTGVCTFYNARSALYHGMKHLGIGEGDEVLLQGYTCISVPNAIIATGASPIYIDIDSSTANMDPALIEQAITPKTKAVLIQHTFGIVADIESIVALCKKHGLLLIEDCAHALGARHNEKYVGLYGDMAIYSLGRDKVITSTNGGILLLPGATEEEIQAINGSLAPVATGMIAKNLLYIIIGRCSYLLYEKKIGKVLYYLAAKTGLLPLILSPAEKTCSFTDFHYVYPNCLADLGVYELTRLIGVNKHRYTGAMRYKKALGDAIVVSDNLGDIYLRVILKTDKQRDIIIQAKKEGLHLGDPRYDKVIAGRGLNLTDAQYTSGSCPQAELLASQTVNLPNHPLMSDADYDRVISFVKAFL